MNSLTYLSRQFDVLTSTPPSTPAPTPPSTPTSELTAFHSLDESSFVVGGSSSSASNSSSTLNRAQAWSSRPAGSSSSPLSLIAAHSTLIGTGSQIPRSRRRSSSHPAASAQPSQKASHTTPAASISVQAKSDESYLRRLYIVRVFFLLYHWIYATWRSLTRRHGPNEVRHEETETSTNEKDTDGEGKGDAISFSALRLRTENAAYPSESQNSSISIAILPRIRISEASHQSSRGSSPLSREITSESPSSLSPSAVPFPKSSTPPPHSATPTSTAPPFLTPKTLVLDLDETLIHSTTRPLPQSGSFGFLGSWGFGGRRRGGSRTIEVVLGGKSTLYHVYKRPFADYFLRKVSGWYTLVIFTASMQEYADPVIDWLDAGRGILARRLFRESCTQLPNGSYTKDLSLIEKDLSRVCLIDNSPISYNINQANGIPIEGWTHDPNDEALLDLLPFLDSLRFTNDVRRILGLRGFS